MAPISADAARPVQKQQARRPLSRIVPAIPHRLSRPVPVARPITPEESCKGAVTQQKPQSEPQSKPAVREKKVEGQPAAAAQAPLTPESKNSAEKPVTEVEEAVKVAASSPVKAQDEELEPIAEAHGKRSKLDDFRTGSNNY
jgi:hypothetical protein